MVIAVLESAGRHDVDRMTEKLLKLPRHPHQVKQRTVLAEIDQQTYVAVRPLVAAGDGVNGTGLSVSFGGRSFAIGLGRSSSKAST